MELDWKGILILAALEEAVTFYELDVVAFEIDDNAVKRIKL